MNFNVGFVDIFNGTELNEVIESMYTINRLMY